MNVNNIPLLQVNRFSPDKYYDGKQALPKEIGELKLFVSGHETKLFIMIGI